MDDCSANHSRRQLRRSLVVCEQCTQDEAETDYRSAWVSVGRACAASGGGCYSMVSVLGLPRQTGLEVSMGN